ncbi:hypothetical protein AB0G60_07695 [Streptomyces angustmyceticus]|uniref:hypothetical protein n=1 Tax=Streptomyces angustmyceticus TaxID=285578 RepID=UPI001581BBAE|nr:hypothetical protein [Streptomyces angustmyceticus]UAL69327.1 hypothetical protein K7396_24625 [Streptomyces angustmyceticus]
MTDEHEEIVEQQADITGLLLHHVYAPLIEDQHVRGVLPAPPTRDAVRVVLGDRDAYATDRLTAYEIPLRVDDELRTPHDVAGLLRTVHTGTHIYPGDKVGSVMGMTLITVDPTTVDPAPFTHDDWTLTLLRCLTTPSTEESPEARLCGFLFLAPDRLRLYLDSSEEALPGMTAADVRPGGALTALLAALPSLLDEQWLTTTDADDPHCSRVVDLTDW